MASGLWMEQEIGEQPEILATNSARFYQELSAKFEGQDYELVLLAARGSSDNAALYARYLIEIFLGIPVTLAAPSVITKFGASLKYPKCLAIGISQSGAAPDVSEVIAYCRRQGHATLAITNTPGSRLTQEAEHSLLLGAGAENSIAATKTYSTSLLALAQLVRVLGGDLGEPVLPTTEWLGSARAEAEVQSGIVVRSAPIFTLGRGFSYCTALESALKLMECALIPAKSYSIADFHHGPKALAGSNSVCLAFGSEPTDGLDSAGSTVIRPHCPDHGVWTPLWEIIFAQYLALLTARARGLDPDQAPNLKKVTETL
jgi:glucosamine--fructose-6-phosphate aminotransferase (isomerizing)